MQLQERYAQFVWIADLAIPDFLAGARRLLAHYPRVLMTMHDSGTFESREEAELVRQSVGIKGSALDWGLLFDLDWAIQPENASRVFVWFDEVYLLGGDVPVDRPGFRLTSETPITTWSIGSLQQLGKWLHQNRCPLALGDGVGLNIATTDTALIEWIEAQYSESAKRPIGAPD